MSQASAALSRGLDYMADVNWLFESDIFDEGTDRLVEEVRGQGKRAEIVHYVPLQSGQTYLDIFPKDACVVFCGSLGFAGQLNRESSWIPGAFYNYRAFYCSSYYPVLGRYHIAEEYIMVPFGDLIRQKDFLFRVVGQEGTIFIRPDSGSKVFTGQLVGYDTYDKDLKLLGFYDVQPQEMCVVSTPRNIDTEWRFVVVDGKVITGSQYHSGGKKDVKAEYPEEARLLAQAVAQAGYTPERAWVCDICRTAAGNYYLLEIGSFSCAGLYACEAEPIVREVSRVAYEEWTEMVPIPVRMRSSDQG